MAAWMLLSNPLFLHPDFSSGAVSKASRSVIEPVEQVTVEENETLWTEVLEMEVELEMVVEQQPELELEVEDEQVEVEVEVDVEVDDELGEHLR